MNDASNLDERMRDYRITAAARSRRIAADFKASKLPWAPRFAALLERHADELDRFSTSADQGAAA